MKKLLAILMAAAMLLTVLSAASCDLGGDNTDETDEYGSVINNDGDTEDDEGNGGNNSGESSENDLPYDKDSAQAKLEELGRKDGYEIIFELSDTYGETTTFKTGRKGEIWWMYDNETSGTAIVQRDEQTVSVYSFDGSEWSLQNNMIGSQMKDVISIYSATMTIYLFMANNYEDSMTRVGTEKVAGRDCIKYTYAAATFGAAATWNASIDKELGITMKWRISAAGDGERANGEVEVTSFKTGSAVTVPTLPEPGEDYQDYSGALGWPSNSFTALLPKAPGTVALSMVQDNQFTCMTKDVTADDFAAYAAELQSKGFTGELTETGFNGTDAKGNAVEVMFVDGQLAISLTKAAE